MKTWNKWAFLAGTWLCCLGFVFPGLVAFLLGGMPDILRGDKFAIAFALSSIVGLFRVLA